MQLFAKLSESLQILDKYRYIEQKNENYMFYGRNIFAFFIASFITAFIMLVTGLYKIGGTSVKDAPPQRSAETQRRLDKLKKLSDAKKA